MKLIFQADQVIAGIIDQTTGEIFSVFQSLHKGFIDYETGIHLLESQLILSGLIAPESGMSFDLEEAKLHKLVDEQAVLHLQVLQNAKKIISKVQSTTFPVVAAFEQGLISESLTVKILELQLSRGHLTIPATGECLTVHQAFQRNMISAALYTQLLERRDVGRDLIDPNTTENVSLEELLEKTVFHKERGLRLLPVTPQEKGRIMLKCGRKITAMRAAHEGLIERETMFRLLGAQLLSGGIIHPDAGHRMTVEEALKEGVVDQDTACAILTQQVQTGGILCPNSSKRLSIDEAVQCNLISSSSALLVLQAQQGVLGLLWPHTGETFPLSTSLHQDMISNELALKILNGRQKIAGLYIPETCEVISLDNAAQQGVIDRNTASVLNSVTLPDKMPNLDDIPVRWLSSCKIYPSAQHDCRKAVDSLDVSKPTPHGSEQTQKLFISYLMTSSYMSANTGHRLLLHCGDINETVSLVMGSTDDEHCVGGPGGQFHDSQVNTEAPDLSQQSEKMLFTHIASSTVCQQTNVQTIISDITRKESGIDCQNVENSENNYFLPVAGDSESSECVRSTLFCKQEDGSGKLATKNRKSEKENGLRSLLEHSEEQMPVDVSENVTEQAYADSDNVEESYSNRSQGNRPSRINEGNTYDAEQRKIKENDNSSGVFDNFSVVNNSSATDKERKVHNSSDVLALAANVQKCMSNILQIKEKIELIKKYEVEDIFQNNSSYSMEPGNALVKEHTEGKSMTCNEGRILQVESNITPLLQNVNDSHGGSPLKAFTDGNVRLSLEDHSMVNGAGLLKDYLDMNVNQPQEDFSICGNTSLENPATKSNGCPLEGHSDFQDAAPLEIRKDSSVSLTLEDCSTNHSMPMLEKHTFTYRDSLFENKTSLINEQQIDTERETSLENRVTICDRQQPVDQDPLCSVSLNDAHAISERALLLDYSTGNTAIGPLPEADTITQSGLPLEDTVAINAGAQLQVGTEAVGGSFIEIDTENQPRTPLPSADDNSAVFAWDRLLLGGNNRRPPEQPAENNSNDSCELEDNSESPPAPHTDCDNESVYNVAKMDEDDYRAADEPGSVEEGAKSQIGWNSKEENIACFSGLRGTTRFEIASLPACHATLQGVILEEEADGPGNVGKKVQKKEKEGRKAAELGPLLNLPEAEMQRVRLGEVRLKGASDSDESACESTHRVKDHNEEEEFDHDYMDWDTSDDTVYEDKGLMTMHYSQCCDKNTEVQVYTVSETTENKDVHSEDNLRLESKCGLLCFENYGDNECQNLAVVSEESIPDPLCKGKDERQESQQTSEPLMENKDILYSSQTSHVCTNSHAAQENVIGTEDIQAELDITPASNLYIGHSKTTTLDDIISLPCSKCDKQQEVDDRKIVETVYDISCSQLEMTALNQSRNGVCILKEVSTDESRERLEETHSPVTERGITLSCDEKIQPHQSSSETAPATHSNGFATGETVNCTGECDLSTYLKECAKDVRVKDILVLREGDLCCLKEGEREDIQNAKEVVKAGSVNSRGKQHPEELNSKVDPSSTSFIPEPMKAKASEEREATIDLQTSHDTSQNYSCAINNIVEMGEKVRKQFYTGCEDHMHVTDVSPTTLNRKDDSWHNTNQKICETVVAVSHVTNSKESVLDHKSTFFENHISETVQQSQKDVVFPNFHLAEEHTECYSEVPTTLPEGLTSILKSKLKDGHGYSKQEDEPLSYTGTRTLMQNLLKMVNVTQWGNEDSRECDTKQMSDDTQTASIAAPLCVIANKKNTIPYHWLNNKHPDILLHILKQDHYNRSTDGTDRRMDENIQAQADQVETAVMHSVPVSQLAYAVPIPNRDGHSAGLESEATEESTPTCNQSLALQEEHQVEKRDHLSKSFFGDVLEPKESVPRPDAVSTVSSNITICFRPKYGQNQVSPLCPSSVWGEVTDVYSSTIQEQAASMG